MEYSIDRLARLAGVSVRTLHYYDEIGLLSPKRISGNGYRVYGQGEVDLLQRILFYRELGLPLAEIKKITQAQDYDGDAALRGHLTALREKRKRIDLLIANVEKTISASKGEITMNDKEKFEGFKQRMIEDNEAAYGAEIREKYGEDAVNASNQKFAGLTKERFEEQETLRRRINDLLRAAFEAGDPADALAQQVCDLHREWLGYFWGGYSKEAHLGLAQMYVDDPRFTKYYDERVAPGAAAFFLEAMKIYCK